MDLTPTECRALDGFVAALRAEYGPGLRDVRLFGSRARDQGHEESDLDVLVLVADELGDEFGAVRSRVFDLAVDQELTHDLILSPFVRTEAAWGELLRLERTIALDIERDGVPL